MSDDERYDTIEEQLWLEYTDFFCEIRDYIIANIDIFSTSSLIDSIEKYRIPNSDTELWKLPQVVDVYNYCVTHQNEVPSNKRDWILGSLLSSNFEYVMQCKDDIVGEYLFTHPDIFNLKIENNVIKIGAIDNVVHFLIPDFNAIQPPEIDSYYDLCTDKLIPNIDVDYSDESEDSES